MPCEAEFSTFESHFLRAIKQQQQQHKQPQTPEQEPNGLPVHLVMADVECWGPEECVVTAVNKGVATAQIEAGRLTIAVPEQWARLTGAIARSPLPVLSARLMERVEWEQGECRRATALLDDLVAASVGSNSDSSSSCEDKELSALLLEYIVKKKEYVTSLRQSRRDVENIFKQASKLLVLMKPHRRTDESDLHDE